MQAKEVDKKLFQICKKSKKVANWKDEPLIEMEYGASIMENK
jgi:hypothetical protein